MTSSKNRYIKQIGDLIFSKQLFMVGLLKSLLFSRRTTICWLLIILIIGCTARVARIPDSGSILDYRKVFKENDLTVAISIQDRPEDPNFLMNRAFKSIKLLVVKIKMKNTGEHRLIINRQDIVLVTEDGRNFIPLNKDAAVDRVEGPLGIYRLRFLGNVADRYRAFGLDEQIVLDPGKEISGYLYYKVKRKYYDPAKAGDIRLLFSRTNVVDSIEYRLKIGEKKGE